MKLHLELEGEQYEIVLHSTPDGFRVESEGESFEAKVDRRGSPVDLNVEGKSHRVEVLNDHEARLDGHPLRFRLFGFSPSLERDALGSQGRLRIQAVMPGRLVRILVQSGQEVQRGEPLFVLEAMKMQNELLSPASGRLGELSVREGDVVEAGRLLAQLFPLDSPPKA